jgi:hypothetical protein
MAKPNCSHLVVGKRKERKGLEPHDTALSLQPRDIRTCHEVPPPKYTTSRTKTLTHGALGDIGANAAESKGSLRAEFPLLSWVAFS